MNKESIAIYNPQNIWEKTVQDTYHLYNEGWLPSFACQLASQSILKLKGIDWIEDKITRTLRTKYFFSPSMCSDKNKMVFVTHNLFLRDIIENNVINAYLHDPIVFVSTPIAFYLLREYPVHITVDWSIIASDNKDKFLDIGGMYISSDNDNDIKISKEAIVKINIQEELGLKKAAATEIYPDVFKIDFDKRDLRPSQKIYDKINRTEAVLEEIDPGEEGKIKVIYPNGEAVVTTQSEFDLRYIVHTASSGKSYIVDINNEIYDLNEKQISSLIKHRLLNSKTVRKLFDGFNVPIDRLNDLDIVIENLDSKYAESDGSVMRLDESLFEDPNFFKHNFYIICHEIVHFCARNSPNWENNTDPDCYFCDDEEVLGFIASIANELESSSSLPEIWSKIYDKIEWHFNKDKDAESFMNRMIEKAKEISKD